MSLVWVRHVTRKVRWGPSPHRTVSQWQTHGRSRRRHSAARPANSRGTRYSSKVRNREVVGRSSRLPTSWGSEAGRPHKATGSRMLRCAGDDGSGSSAPDRGSTAWVRTSASRRSDRGEAAPFRHRAMNQPNWRHSIISSPRNLIRLRYVETERLGSHGRGTAGDGVP
jgi:hypothetical protein